MSDEGMGRPVDSSEQATSDSYDQAFDNIPVCPTCGKSDMVEDSVAPEKWDGYCYRCTQPFKVVPT